MSSDRSSGARPRPVPSSGWSAPCPARAPDLTAAPVPRVGLALLASRARRRAAAGLVGPLVGGRRAWPPRRPPTTSSPCRPSSTRRSLSLRSRVLAADGSPARATFYRVNRVEVPFEEIPEHDAPGHRRHRGRRFYEHHGVDYKGTLRAAVTNARSGAVAQGGSTLTQQYVKNALIEAATDKAGQQAARRAVRRSASCRRRATPWRSSATLTKDEILHALPEDRLLRQRRVRHRHRRARTTSASPSSAAHRCAESALLAGVVQNPAALQRREQGPRSAGRADDRRDIVLARMRDVGCHHGASGPRRRPAAELPAVTLGQVGRGCEAPPASSAPFFCDYVRRELEDTPIGAALGQTREERQSSAVRRRADHPHHPGPADPVHEAAQKAVDAQVPRDDPSGVAAATDVVEPGTGAHQGDGRQPALRRGARPGRDQGQPARPAARSASRPGRRSSRSSWPRRCEQGIPLATSSTRPRSTPADRVRQLQGRRRQAASRSATPATREAGTFDLRHRHARLGQHLLRPARRSAPGWRSRWRSPRRSACASSTGAADKPLPGCPRRCSAAPR